MEEAMYVFDKKMGRLKFIKNAAALATAGVLAGCEDMGPKFKKTEHPLKKNAKGAAQWGRQAGEWIPSCCNMCGGQSGIMCHVVNGVVDKIEPNHWNPNNYTNISEDFFQGYSSDFGCAEGGVICPKGNAGIAQLYDPDRVKKPLKRTNPDRNPGADPAWKEITWDQALDEIAAKMGKLRSSGNAHKLLWMSEDHSFTHVQGDFCKLFGTPNYYMHSNLCDVGRKAGFKMAMGDERPLADFMQSKFILLFGWNPTSAIKWVYLPRILTRAVEKGARLVVVDPYLSDTAAKAHEWVPIRPGTDGAMALAMGHVIIKEKLYDKAFVRDWTVGFEEYAAYVSNTTPDWAEKITSVPAKTIARLAREFAQTRPSVVDAWSGPGQHSNGVQAIRAIAMLAGLVGGIDRPGTLILPKKEGNKHGHCEPDATAAGTLSKPRFDEVEKYPLGHKSGVYTQMINNLADGKGPYKPSMLMCIFQNPAMSVPGSKFAEAVKNLETFVVVDTHLSETAQYADYVLPGTTYLERYDLNTHWVTWPALGLRQPVVKPLFGQPAEYEIVALLGRKLKLRTKEGVEFFYHGPHSKKTIENVTQWYEDYLSHELMEGAPKITLEELKRLPGAVWVDKKGTEYEKYKKPVAKDKLEKAFVDGKKIFDKPKGKRLGTYFGNVPLRGFFTESGKFEFFQAKWAEKKDAQGRLVDALPKYQARDWQPDADYPLYLINWKEASHTHSRTQNNSLLLELKGDNPLVIHPDTAEKLKIKDNAEVWVESKFGKTLARAKVTKRIHPEVVGAQHGFGHSQFGALAKGRGTNFGVLNKTVSDPLSGQALHKEICVKVYPA
jgi:thiosulfate reductase/polysulfide reductase chain A